MKGWGLKKCAGVFFVCGRVFVLFVINSLL
jgi:hypothetical protein